MQKEYNEDKPIPKILIKQEQTSNMKKILLSGIVGLVMATGLIGTASAQYYSNNSQYYYPYTYNQNTSYTIRQISPCLSYKYNYYGQIIETINTCNNYNYSNYYSSPCVQIQTYPYMNNNCNSNYYSNYSNSGYQNNYYPSYNNTCAYYYYDMDGDYMCGSYNYNSYYPYMNYNNMMNYTPMYTPTNYYYGY